MGAPMRHLVAPVALLCTYMAAACGASAEGCSGFKHLENGRTFFRYGGLLVVFSCHPGYKLHGYRTNSCVSGHWSRDPPVCVGSGCSSPGPLTHGTSSINSEGSWAVFSCNSGYRLHGPSMLYCKNHAWNSTMPVCKESDMMSSVTRFHVQKDLSYQAAVVARTQQGFHYNTLDTLTNTASKERSSNDLDLKFRLKLSHNQSQTSNSERVEMTDPRLHLQQRDHYPDSKIEDGSQAKIHEAQGANEAGPGASIEPETGTGSRGPAESVSASPEGAEKVDRVTQAPLTPVARIPSKSHQTASVSSPLSLELGIRSTASPPPVSTAHTSAAAAAVKQIPPTETLTLAPTSPLHHTRSAPPAGESVTFKDEVTPSGSAKSADIDQQARSDLQSLSPASSDGGEEPTETSTCTSSTSGSSVSTDSLFTSSPPPTASSLQSSPISFTPSKVKETNQTLHTSAPAGQTPHWTEHHNITMNSFTAPTVSLGRRPVCPYPAVPTHGTFYFRNIEDPGPGEYRHYIQYACYPSYTLAHGDVYSYCQQDGSWSGVTPVCLEVTPCSINNGGCSQLCSHSENNQTSNRTQTRTECGCSPGFTLLDDGRTCRDVDECVEDQHQCQQRCINTFGSFKCGCDGGYQPTKDPTSCTDVDECLLPVAVTGCVFGCVNTPGSFHCQCPVGYSLHTADGHCQDIDECAVNQGLGPCMEQCHNIPGSYRCSCTYGNILAGDGHSCIAECPPGFRKQPAAATPENSTSQARKEECVDINECLEEKCEWKCVNLPGSHHCICPRGYTLQKDGRRCKDLNECSRKNGGCSHLCVNQKGGYKCACPASHRLSSYSWKKCIIRTTVSTAGQAGNH